MRSVLNTMEKDNEKVRVINHQFKANCKFRGLSQKHMKEQSSPAAREQKMLRISPQTLITRVAEHQRTLNCQSYSKSAMPRSEPWLGRDGPCDLGWG